MFFLISPLGNIIPLLFPSVCMSPDTKGWRIFDHLPSRGPNSTGERQDGLLFYTDMMFSVDLAFFVSFNVPDVVIGVIFQTPLVTNYLRYYINVLFSPGRIKICLHFNGCFRTSGPYYRVFWYNGRFKKPEIARWKLPTKPNKSEERRILCLPTPGISGVKNHGGVV